MNSQVFTALYADNIIAILRNLYLDFCTYFCSVIKDLKAPDLHSDGYAGRSLMLLNSLLQDLTPPADG
jgi:hypothetical protein